MVTNNAINVATAATGKYLQGAGVGTAPTFSTATLPSTATGTGTILRADGTNWVATTATYPATTTAFQLLVSTATSVVGGLTAGSTGQVLTGVSGAVPAFSATPSVTSITFGSGSALSTYTGFTSYTPVLSFGGGSTGIVYATQTGYYSQIGNLVFVSVFIDLTNKGSSTGSASVTLPVTPSSSVPQVLTVRSGSITFGAGNTTLHFLLNNLLFQSSGSAVGANNLDNTAFVNTSSFIMTGCYSA